MLAAVTLKSDPLVPIYVVYIGTGVASSRKNCIFANMFLL